MSLADGDIWEQLLELDRKLLDTSRPSPEDRETKRLFIKAVLQLRDEIAAIRALARSR